MLASIKRLCKAQKKTISRMEKDLGFAQNSVTRWDKNTPSVDKVAAVAAYLGTTVDAIIREDE